MWEDAVEVFGLQNINFMRLSNDRSWLWETGAFQETDAVSVVGSFDFEFVLARS